MLVRAREHIWSYLGDHAEAYTRELMEPDGLSVQQLSLPLNKMEEEGLLTSRHHDSPDKDNWPRRYFRKAM